MRPASKPLWHWSDFMLPRSLARLFERRPRLPFEARKSWPSFPEDLRLKGEKVWLRWTRPSDAEDVFAYASDDAVSRFMDWSSHEGIEESRRFLQALDRSRAAGREAPFGIIERGTDDLIGICSFVAQADAETAELGYALRKSAWGKGFMTEAARLACSWAFENLPLKEIFAEAHPDNVASGRVLEKVGFARCPKVVYRNIKGFQTPHHRYRLLKDR